MVALEPTQSQDEGDGITPSTSQCSSQSNSYTRRSPNAELTLRLPTTGTKAAMPCMPAVDESVVENEENEEEGAAEEAGASQQLDKLEGMLDVCCTTKKLCNDDYRRNAYAQQVKAWQQEEQAFLKHGEWCEQRIIILLQEAFRCSYTHLKRSYRDGAMSAQTFDERRQALRTSLESMKSSYRRTIESAKSRKDDVMAIATKAAACIASVYPWSSDGFLLSFEENMHFGRVSLSSDKNPFHHGGPTPITTAPTPQRAPATPPQPTPQTGLDAQTQAATVDASEASAPLPPTSAATARNGLAKGLPPVALRRLAPRRQVFHKGVAPDGSPLLSSTTSAATEASSAVSQGSASHHRRFAAFSPGATTAVALPATCGPLRPSEGSYFQRQEIEVSGMAFTCTSLVSSMFFAFRRAAIAAATKRQRLASSSAADPLCNSTVPARRRRPVTIRTDSSATPEAALDTAARKTSTAATPDFVPSPVSPCCFSKAQPFAVDAPPPPIDAGPAMASQVWQQATPPGPFYQPPGVYLPPYASLYCNPSAGMPAVTPPPPLYGQRPAATQPAPPLYPSRCAAVVNPLCCGHQTTRAGSAGLSFAASPNQQTAPMVDDQYVKQLW